MLKARIEITAIYQNHKLKIKLNCSLNEHFNYYNFFFNISLINLGFALPPETFIA